MDEYEIRGLYISYIIARFPDPYEDLPEDETLDYQDFKKMVENKGEM